ncbi:hypothetical protein MCOR04_011848 [Pyricularia oryzae]|nr:hypothetical protein MCOR04_011848 [Pyricularia oryzae]
MPSCSACQSRGIPRCQASPRDSARCTECVRLNLSHCDVLGVSPESLRRIASQHSRLESELEAAEEARRAADLKVERLRKQKKLWFERMMRAVSRGIDDLEELDRVEREEAEQEERRRSAEVLPEVSLESLLPDSNFVWDSTFPMGPLNPSLLDEMNVLAQHSVGSSGGMVSSPGRSLTSGNGRWCFLRSSSFPWLTCSQIQLLVVLAERFLAILEVVKGFPGVFFMSIVFPFNKVFCLAVVPSVVEYSFNVVCLFCIDLDRFLCASAVWCRLQ